MSSLSTLRIFQPRYQLRQTLSIVLRQCLFDSLGPGLIFREHGQPLAYGLTITNPSTSAMMRSLIMAIQAQILRTLLFDSAVLKLPKTWFVVGFSLFSVVSLRGWKPSYH